MDALVYFDLSRVMYGLEKCQDVLSFSFVFCSLFVAVAEEASLLLPFLMPGLNLIKVELNYSV